MRSMRALGLLIVVAGTSIAAPLPKDTKYRSDAERMAGSWDMPVSKTSGRDYTQAIWVFKDGKMFAYSSKADENPSEWKITLDTTTNPKRITIGTYAGIYEFDRDRIRIAYTLTSTHPEKFNPDENPYYCELVRHKE